MYIFHHNMHFETNLTMCHKSVCSTRRLCSFDVSNFFFAPNVLSVIKTDLFRAPLFNIRRIVGVGMSKSKKTTWSSGIIQHMSTYCLYIHNVKEQVTEMFLQCLLYTIWTFCLEYVLLKRSSIDSFFNFHITNFPFLSSNIPSSPAYGVLSHSSYGMPGLAPLMNVLF